MEAQGFSSGQHKSKAEVETCNPGAYRHIFQQGAPKYEPLQHNTVLSVKNILNCRIRPSAPCVPTLSDGLEMHSTLNTTCLSTSELLSLASLQYEGSQASFWKRSRPFALPKSPGLSLVTRVWLPVAHNDGWNAEGRRASLFPSSLRHAGSLTVCARLVIRCLFRVESVIDLIACTPKPHQHHTTESFIQAQLRALPKEQRSHIYDTKGRACSTSSTTIEIAEPAKCDSAKRPKVQYNARCSAVPVVIVIKCKVSQSNQNTFQHRKKCLNHMLPLSELKEASCERDDAKRGHLRSCQADQTSNDCQQFTAYQHK